MLMVAKLLKGKTVAEDVSLVIAPGSRQVLDMLSACGALTDILDAGARVLLRAVARLGLDDMRGAAFLAHHAAGEDWSRLQPRLAALDEGDARRRASVASGARDAFAHVRACFARSFDALSTDTP